MGQRKKNRISSLYRAVKKKLEQDVISSFRISGKFVVTSTFQSIRYSKDIKLVPFSWVNLVNDFSQVIFKSKEILFSEWDSIATKTQNQFHIANYNRKIQAKGKTGTTDFDHQHMNSSSAAIVSPRKIYQ